MKEGNKIKLFCFIVLILAPLFFNSCSRKSETPAEKIKSLTQIINENPKDTSAIHERMGLYFKIGNNNLALNDLKSLISIDSLNPKNYLISGLYFQNENPKKAIDDFSKLIQLDSSFHFAYMYRSWTYANLHQYKLSIKDLNHFIKLEPKKSLGYYFRSLYYFYDGDLKNAIHDGKEDIKLGDTTNIYFLADLLLLDGDYSRAVKMILSNKDYLSSLNARDLIIGLYKLKKYRDVIDFANNPHYREYNSSNAHFFIALSYFQLAEYDSSKYYLRKAIKEGFWDFNNKLVLPLKKNKEINHLILAAKESPHCIKKEKEFNSIIEMKKINSDSVYDLYRTIQNDIIKDRSRLKLIIRLDLMLDDFIKK